MSDRIRHLLAACLYMLESRLIDVHLWCLHRIERLLVRQINLMDAVIACTEKDL